MERIKSLDGLRAISIIMVLFGHVGFTLPLEVSQNLVYRTFSNASLGVNIFFVISGFLITKILILEKEKNNFINIRQFYIRRSLRIFPVFYTYIFVLIILKYFFIDDIIENYSDIVPAGLYLWNYNHLFSNTDTNTEWFLGHFWSLSMEEQFYLVWPITFSIIYAKKSNRKTINILCVILLFFPILRLITYFLLDSTRAQLSMMLHTGGDAIVVGCLGALIDNTKSFHTKYLHIVQNKTLIIILVLFLIVISPMLSNYLGGYYIIPLGMSINNIIILILLFWCIYIPSKFSNFINKNWIIHVGTLSYSLYVWQQLFLTNLNQSWFGAFPQNLIMVFIVGYLSFYLVEKPILKLKNRTKLFPSTRKQTEITSTIIP